MATSIVFYAIDISGTERISPKLRNECDISGGTGDGLIISLSTGMDDDGPRAAVVLRDGTVAGSVCGDRPPVCRTGLLDVPARPGRPACRRGRGPGGLPAA